ncbi:hypothetical protein Hanom_Chr09g00767471 [Helianthus anomalus]
MIRSSTYKQITILEFLEFLINNVCSYTHFLNPFDLNYLSILLYHALGACFKPYGAFLRRHTFCSSHFLMYPSGCSVYTCSFRLPFKKVVFTSI